MKDPIAVKFKEDLEKAMLQVTWDALTFRIASLVMDLLEILDDRTRDAVIADIKRKYR